MPEDSQDVLDRIDREKEGYLSELKEFLRIPSVSTDPQYKDEVIRCSDFVVERMRDAGLAAERIETDGYPLVYGEWTGAPGKPTLLFYGHYDVQPPEPLEEWRNPPFEPTEEGDLLVVGWGSTFGAINQALQEALEQGETVSHIHIRHLYPFPENLGDLLAGFDKVIMPGERETTLARDAAANGIVIGDGVWAGIVEAAKSVGVEA